MVQALSIGKRSVNLTLALGRGQLMQVLTPVIARDAWTVAAGEV